MEWEEFYELEDLLEDNPLFERDKYDDESLNRLWRGNGIILAKLSYESLQELETTINNDYIRSSVRMILNRKEIDNFSRKLSL